MFFYPTPMTENLGDEALVLCCTVQHMTSTSVQMQKNLNVLMIKNVMIIDRQLKYCCNNNA